MKKYRILALFSNFDETINAIDDVRQGKVAGVGIDDITVLSPIEHHGIVEALGHRKSHVPKFTFAGAIFGVIGGFTFLAAAQASFLIQPQGGKPIIAIPTNIVLTYEMMIMSAMLTTVVVFIISSKLLRKRKRMYSENISIDQVGIEMELDEHTIEPIKELFLQHQAVEIREEVIQ